MPAKFQVVALSSNDPDGMDRRNEPQLAYPDALKTAQSLKFQGKAFRVFIDGEHSEEEIRSFRNLGGLM